MQLLKHNKSAYSHIIHRRRSTLLHRWSKSLKIECHFECGPAPHTHSHSHSANRRWNYIRFESKSSADRTQVELDGGIEGIHDEQILKIMYHCNFYTLLIFCHRYDAVSRAARHSSMTRMCSFWLGRLPIYSSNINSQPNDTHHLAIHITVWVMPDKLLSEWHNFSAVRRSIWTTVCSVHLYSYKKKYLVCCCCCHIWCESDANAYVVHMKSEGIMSVHDGSERQKSNRGRERQKR